MLEFFGRKKVDETSAVNEAALAKKKEDEKEKADSLV